MTVQAYTMKSNLRLSAMVMVLLTASLSGCLGGDDGMPGEYTGPIDLVVYYDSTSGMVEESYNNGQAGPKTGVELSFDFASTVSDDGDIVKIMLDPDDGSSPVEGNPSDDATLSYTWLTHGLFFVTLSAEDENGNSHSIEVKIKIDMHIVWTDSNTQTASMQFNGESDCTDGDPYPDRITISSTVENPDNGFFGGPSDVTWSLKNPESTEVASQNGNIPEGSEETWDYTTRDVTPGMWTLTVEIGENSDSVNVNNDVTIAYAEGSESSVNPRPA